LRNLVLPEKISGQIASSKLAAKAPVSGLQLIQFRAKLTPEWRELLSANGVDLLHYVPDDAFIARFNNVSADQIRALPFVEWVGDYRPETKVHRALKAGVAARSTRACHSSRETLARAATSSIHRSAPCLSRRPWTRPALHSVSRTATLMKNGGKLRYSAALGEHESGFLNGPRRSVNRKV